ncbi:MAG: glycoside hydrolase family 32 protein [Steroidobacteraceae bacterium]
MRTRIDRSAAPRRLAFTLTLACAGLAAGAGMALGNPSPRPVGAGAWYDQPYRPQVHFSPARHWMNDPNGLVYFKGRYHLFFQYNPYGSRWGHMSWGHAVSRDLVHWRQWPVAIPEGRRNMIFSGSVVLDRRDTSGFGAPGQVPLVAIYTASPRDGHGPQTQDLAYSLDGGMHWRKYAGNPVLDIGRRNFRDPKVFWYAPLHHWVMVVSLAKARRVSFYSSPDLKRWTHTGDFGPAGNTRGVWECPDLMQLPVENRPGATRWVLKVDSQHLAPGDGGAGQVFVGRFNGRTFVASQRTAQSLDLGEDYYASTSWSNLPDPGPGAIMLGWMDNWLYAQDAPTAPWRGAMAFPRRVFLRLTDGTYRLMQRPVGAIRSLRGSPRSLARAALGSEQPLFRVAASGSAHEIRARVQVGRRGRFAWVIGSGDGRTVTLAYDAARRRFAVSRAGLYRFSGKFDSRHGAPFQSPAGRIDLDVIIDRSSVEAFVDGGALTVAELMFPDHGAYTVRLRTRGARVERLELYRLRSIW